LNAFIGITVSGVVELLAGLTLADSASNLGFYCGFKRPADHALHYFLLRLLQILRGIAVGQQLINQVGGLLGHGLLLRGVSGLQIHS